jgi:hypothetical protein
MMLGRAASVSSWFVEVQQQQMRPRYQAQELSNQPLEGTRMMTVRDKEQAAEMTAEEWLAIRKEAGLKIDPETAEVCWCWAQVADPYGVFPELSEEWDCVGRVYFARSPESDIWVCFHDLPETTLTALRQRRETIDDDVPF